MISHIKTMIPSEGEQWGRYNLPRYMLCHPWHRPLSDNLTCPNEAAATGAGVISENLRVQRVLRRYPPANIQKAIENGHLYMIYPLKMVIFNSKLLVYQRVWVNTTSSCWLSTCWKTPLEHMFQHHYTSVFFDHLPKVPWRGLKIEDDWNHQPECVGGVGITHCPKDWSDWSSCDPFLSHNQPD